MVLVGGRILVCGGVSDGCYSASVTSLNLGQGLTEACGGVPVWQTLPSMHGPRADCAVAVSGGCVYVCGGEEGAGPALASVERLDCRRMVAWESLPAMAVVRAGAAAVVAAGHLLVFGGYSDEPLASAESLDLREAASWKPLPDMLGGPRSGCVAFACSP